MSMMLIENADGVLWLSGNVMPSEEKRLNDELRQYIKVTSKDARIIDMSAVKYISSSAAKTLLTVAQEANARGGKIKVRSSIPVVRTLSLLGAETWCEVEPCREPNRRPGQTSVSSSRIVAVTPSVQKSDSNPRIVAVDPSVAKRESNTNLTPVSSSVSDLPPTLDDMEVKEALSERKSTVGLNAPGTSIVRHSIGQTGPEAALVAGAAARAGLPLVNEDAELQEDLAALKKLVVMKTYTFQMPGMKSDITGKVLARVGGPWILIDTHGAKKMLNIKQVTIIDILA
jgi:anti-anti-sigma regulatory factor